jgi:hypothetical protein
MFSTDRAALYDEISRHLYPRDREAFRLHENELCHYNRQHHNVNFPRPRTAPPLPEDTEAAETTQTQTFPLSATGRRLTSYVGTRRVQPPRMLEQEIVDRASRCEFADKERIAVAVIRGLLRAGLKMETIQRGLGNMTFTFSADRANCEMTIDIHL